MKKIKLNRQELEVQKCLRNFEEEISHIKGVSYYVYIERDNGFHNIHFRSKNITKDAENFSLRGIESLLASVTDLSRITYFGSVLSGLASRIMSKEFSVSFLLQMAALKKKLKELT